ncbi:MAG: sigma-70 family RNA polymerase sigma factor, partial [Planctomycetota bacterium]|nr:sigma-70 family RNA polymerase sigma factor [Planctomycetota bacterium]
MTSTQKLRPEALLEHAGFVRALARRLLADPHAADDVVQETWLAALRKPPRDKTRLRAWLGTVARRLALKRRRSGGRRPRRERRAARTEALPSTAAVVAQLEVQRNVVAAVMTLEEPYRSTIVHRFLHDRSPREIAEASGVPLKTVESRITRALKQLRARLDDDHGRSAWTVALLPLAWPGKAAAATTTSVLVTGGVVSMKLKWAAVVVAVVAAGGGVWALREGRGRGVAKRAVRASESPIERPGTRDVPEDPEAQAPFEPQDAGAPAAPAWAEGRYSATIRTTDGRPVPPATTVSLGGKAVRTVKPDAGGVFSFDELPAGSYELEIEAEGYASEYASFHISKAFSHHANRLLIISRGGAVRVRVQGVDGRPRPKFAYTIDGDRMKGIATTNEEGVGGWSGLAIGSYSVGFEFGGTTHVVLLHRLTRDKEVDLEIVPDARVIGLLRDAAGRPLAHATLAFSDRVLKVQAETGADGRYAVRGLAPGRYLVTATGRGFAARCGELAVRRQAQTEYDIVLGPASIAGRVRPATQRPWISLAGPVWLMT